MINEIVHETSIIKEGFHRFNQVCTGSWERRPDQTSERPAKAVMNYSRRLF